MSLGETPTHTSVAESHEPTESVDTSFEIQKLHEPIDQLPCAELARTPEFQRLQPQHRDALLAKLKGLSREKIERNMPAIMALMHTILSQYAANEADTTAAAEDDAKVAEATQEEVRGRQREAAATRTLELAKRVEYGTASKSDVAQLGMLMQNVKPYVLSDKSPIGIQNDAGVFESSQYDTSNDVVGAVEKRDRTEPAVSIVRKLTGRSEDALDCFAEKPDTRQAVYGLMEDMVPTFDSVADRQRQFEQQLVALMQTYKTDDLSEALALSGVVEHGEIQKEALSAWHDHHERTRLAANDNPDDESAQLAA